MERSLLIGNGLNQVFDQDVSWGDLMNKLAGNPKGEHEKKVRDAKPFVLLFEELSDKENVRVLKQKIIDHLDGIKPNKFHADLIDLDIKNILTTNYDYNLERAFGDSGWEKRHSAREKYYSLFRRNSIWGKNIWHIHGELRSINSIMLGHEHYTGYNQKISNYLSSGVPTEAKGVKGKSYFSKFSSKARGRGSNVETWVDIFLETEVHIIGFSLDYAENHLWSLITKKNKLAKEKKHELGRIVFHRCSDKEMTIEDEARLSILSALGVKLEPHIEDTYEEAYNDCIRSLRR